MKAFLTLFLISFSTVSILAQVGINTTTPDPSSVLDMSSTEAGMLAPRMTTAQRNLITSPAQGLLVYDTDEESFYFFDTVWMPLNSSVKRDNYKLVKDISDLADELLAGGGSRYLLNTDFLYEINGTILVDFPIEFNGAYIEGVDSGEDVLFNNSGSALFTGSTAGSLRNLTINGNGSQIFSILGSGTGTLVVNNSVIAGASALGSISNIAISFFSITQFVGNLDGLILSDMTTAFMQGVFWNSSNAGTFVTLTGTFDNIDIRNGRVEVQTGETGIDVSSNPTINNGAALGGISFLGDGTLIDGYTAGTYVGFNFTRNWDVDCPGLSLETDAAATGDINFNFTAGGGASTSFPSNGTPVKLAGITTSNDLFRFTRSGNNRIIYDGRKTRFFNVNTSISFESLNPGSRYIFYIAKGNSGVATPTVIAETGAWRTVGNAAGGGAGNADITALPVIGTIQLSPGDYIEVWAERFSGSGQIFTVALNLSIR